MRKLNKGQCPVILANNAVAWTNDLIGSIARGEKPTDTQKSRYNHPDIKSALLAETHEKCAYCESHFRHVSYGDIEHMIPKSKRPEHSFDWINLTAACTVCNVNKGDFYCAPGDDDNSSFVDPYVDDPSDFFIFFREAVIPAFGQPRAHTTNDVIKLDRGELVEQRRKQMEAIDDMLKAIAFAPPELKPMFRADLQKRYLSDDSAYVQTARHYINHLTSIGMMP